MLALGLGRCVAPMYFVVSLVAKIKPNIVNIWPKINALISSFNFFKGGKGICRENYDPHGLPYGLGCHFPPRVGGGSYPCGCFKMLKWLSALIFVFNFCINI